MEGFKYIPYIALMIVISGVIIGAGVVSLSEFGDSISDKCWNASWTYNSTTGTCDNNTLVNGPIGPGDSNFTFEFYATDEASNAEGSLAEQLPTVAIIGIMVIIISIIGGVFVYLKFFR